MRICELSPQGTMENDPLYFIAALFMFFPIHSGSVFCKYFHPFKKRCNNTSETSLEIISAKLFYFQQLAVTVYETKSVQNK